MNSCILSFIPLMKDTTLYEFVDFALHNLNERLFVNRRHYPTLISGFPNKICSYDIAFRGGFNILFSRMTIVIVILLKTVLIHMLFSFISFITCYYIYKTSSPIVLLIGLLICVLVKFLYS